MYLKEKEIHFFREHGFLIKRDLLPPEPFEKSMEIVQKHIKLGKTENKSHQGASGFSVKITGNPEWKGLLADNPVIFSSVEQLVAPQKVLFSKSRGCIGVNPGSKERGMHVDAVVPGGHSYVFVAAYLRKVGTDEGGFTVIPKSHQVVKNLWPLEDHYQPSKNGMLLTDVPYVQFTGKPGDVCFVHHMLLHQHTKNLSNNTRYATFANFMIEGEI